MTKKPEKLARELVGLVSKYSDADIDAALELIGDGDLFARLRPAVRTTKEKLRTATKPSRVLSLKDIASRLEDISDTVPPEERTQLLELLEKLDRVELLQSGATLRSYAERIGLALPAKLPARTVIVRRIVERLATIPVQDRTELIASAEREGGTQSSLKGWSDLIVKRKD